MTNIKREYCIKNLFGGFLLSFFLVGVLQAQEEELVKTPEQVAGPFYPGENLIENNGDSDLSNEYSAQGSPIVLDGKLVTQDGQVVPNARIHLWQTDGLSGRYFNDTREEALDENFDYYGKSVTDNNGAFQLKTVRPIEYPVGDEWVRPDHLHVRVFVDDRVVLTTQLYFSGDEFLAQDLILQRLTEGERNSVIVEYTEDQELSELAGKTVLKGTVQIVL